MMNREQALDFAKASAKMALDQSGEWGGMQASIDTYRCNIRCTLKDERATEHEAEAWALFDAKVARRTVTA